MREENFKKIVEIGDLNNLGKINAGQMLVLHTIVSIKNAMEESKLKTLDELYSTTLEGYLR